VNPKIVFCTISDYGMTIQGEGSSIDIAHSDAGAAWDWLRGASR
jgi:hypothetical protein